MGDLRLLIDLHKNQHRQGPGGDTETKRALDLCRIDKSAPLKIADIGCGTGASTLVLARQLNATITAVDFLDEFLEELNSRAMEANLSDKITTLACSMDNLPFDDEEFDIIWSEGAIYNIGFEKGINSWKRFLKTGGFLVASEITWTTVSRPPEILNHWENEYSEIDVASSKIAALEKAGYSPVGYFTLPERCWIQNYYKPIRETFDDFLKRNGQSDEAQAIVKSEKKEIELYKNYKEYFNYGVYIAKKRV